MRVWFREYEFNNGKFVPEDECKVKFNRDGSINLERIIKFGKSYGYLNDNADADNYKIDEKDDTYWIGRNDEDIYLIKITKEE